MDRVDAPTVPGVYFLLDGRGRLSYVGKAANLRRRLGEHARSNRWRGVCDVRWELHSTAWAAELREADILLALQPRHNRAHFDDYFAFVSRTTRGLTLGREGDYGCFPQLGTGATSLAGRTCIDGFNALQRLAPRLDDPMLDAFLAGRSGALTIPLDDEQPHVAHGVRKDIDLASAFFDAGPRRLRDLRVRHGRDGIVTREMFVEWITAEVEELLA